MATTKAATHPPEHVRLTDDVTTMFLKLTAVLSAGGTLSTGQAPAYDLDIELAARVGGGSPSPLYGPNPLAVGVGARGGVVWR